MKKKVNHNNYYGKLKFVRVLSSDLFWTLGRQLSARNLVAPKPGSHSTVVTVRSYVDFILCSVCFSQEFPKTQASRPNRRGSFLSVPFRRAHIGYQIWKITSLVHVTTQYRRRRDPNFKKTLEAAFSTAMGHYFVQRMASVRASCAQYTNTGKDSHTAVQYLYRKTQLFPT